MNELKFINNYLNIYQDLLINNYIHNKIIALKDLMVGIKKNHNKILIFGNGGSAATASHVSVDFTKQAGVRTQNFNEADLITCFSNDYGYENWVEKSIEYYSDENDLVIFISSSGESANMINGISKANMLNLKTVTFTGFNSDNPLKQRGILNFWVDSKAYNVVEMIHQIWLLMACDLVIGKIEYSA